MNSKNYYVIGVDGGGTKTEAALADLNGKILKIGKSGSSHPRNLGIKKAVENLARAISLIIKGRKVKILSTFIGLPAIAEEFKSKTNQIKNELKRHKESSKIFKGKIQIDSDQRIAFRSGADGDGVMLNCGTGCVAHGWRRSREIHVSGWGWLADEGGAFFVGQKVFQSIFKNLDGRGQNTLLTNFVFKKFKIRDKDEFLKVVYGNHTKILSLLSVFCDETSKRGDKVARKIMIESGKEAALTAKTAIKKLNFRKLEFPLVLVGGMFKSKIFLETVKKEIKVFSPKARIVLLKKKAVIGAVKLAIENL